MTATAGPPADSAPDSAADSKRRSSSTKLAGIGVFLAAGWLISFVLGGATVAGGVPEGVRVAAGLSGGVVAPVLATTAAVQLAGPALRLTRGRSFIIVGAAALAFCSLALVALSFSTGMDEADAGRPAGLLGTLTLIFTIASVVAFASVVALALFAVVRSRGLAVRPGALIAASVGVVAGPLLAWSLLSPVPVALFCIAVFLVAVVPRGLARPASANANGLTATPPAVDPVRLRARVTFYAAVSLASILIVWITGLGVSIAGTGTDGATTGLGLASAVGQLAVVPLLWAATLVISVRVPRATSSARAGFVGATVLVIAAAGVMVIGYSAGGELFVPLVGVLSFGVGLWCGSVAWPLTDGWPTLARGATTAVGVVATALLYAVLVAFSGGVTLALASGFVAFGGARYLVRMRVAESSNPATPAVS